jgi:hypothetical protein
VSPLRVERVKRTDESPYIQVQGHVELRKQGGGMKSELYGYEAQLAEMVEKYPDATLSQSCEYWGKTHNQWLL